MEKSLHEEDLHNDKGIGLSSLVALVTFFIELYFVYMLDVKEATIIDVLIPHFFVCILLAGWTRYCYIKEEDLRFSTLLVVLVAFTGIFGAGMCLIYVIMYWFYSKKAIPFEEWFALLFPEESSNERDKLYERILFGLDDTSDSSDIEPFNDILEYGTLSQKQLAIAKITRYFQPKFASALLQAINAKESSIRVQAATSIAKIEHGFMDKTIKMEKKLAEHPDDIDRLKKFAILCDHYAHSGILDDDRARNIRNKAIKAYEKCIEEEEKGEKIRRNLGRLYVKNGDYDKALILFEKCINDEGFASPELVMWYMEVLYIKKDFQKIREISDLSVHYASKLSDDMKSSLKVIEMLEMWHKGLEHHKLKVERKA